MKFFLPFVLSLALVVNAAAISYALTITDLVYITSYTTVKIFSKPPGMLDGTSSNVALSTSSTTNTGATLAVTSTPSDTTSKTSSAISVSSSSASPSVTPILNQFEIDILKAHNDKRALHGVAPLTYNPTLAQFAADYAAKSFDCDHVDLIHSGGPYGENLAAGYVGGFAPVDAWYDEISLYNYANPGYSPATGHFTQVVWKATSELGCAYVTCNNAWRQYTICEYQAPGNFIGEFEENVLPLVSQ